ncbi:carbonic anhydrase [Oceanobacillus sp. CAU 1775]
MEDLELREKNEEFIRKIKEVDPFFFDELKKGQAPEYFVLSCSDSRVSPSIITQMPLGQMFVHRNIANQVVTEDESFSASLYFALVHLNVKKILIKGHTECGGIKAAWLDNDEKELHGWISNVRESLPSKHDLKEISMDELAKINVLKQVEHLKQHPIYKAYGNNVEVRGCLFHVESGELERLT